MRDVGAAGLADGLAAWMETAGLYGAGLVADSFGCQGTHPGLAACLVLQGPTMDAQARDLALAARQPARAHEPLAVAPRLPGGRSTTGADDLPDSTARPRRGRAAAG